jgi:hypothetical protein
MELNSLIKDFGMPTALAVYFIWRDYKTQKEYRVDLKELLLKATDALNKNTDVMQQLLTRKA